MLLHIVRSNILQEGSGVNQMRWRGSNSNLFGHSIILSTDTKLGAPACQITAFVHAGLALTFTQR